MYITRSIGFIPHCQRIYTIRCKDGEDFTNCVL